jgi:outer membrane lipase/esterase
MTGRHLKRALLCATLFSFATMSSPAAAQQIDRIIVFGDSYADIGNAFRLGGVNPITTQVYTTGRFTGGSNYIDTLTDILQVPQYNFAIGGARTNNGNQTVGLPGLTTEVQLFLAGGGTLGFPVVNTTLDRSDLVAVSIGGNDARAYQLGGGTLAGAPASAATAVTNFQQNFNLVMARGTPTISFLAGDTGLLPEISTNPTGAAIRTAYSTAFNNGVQQVLAGYAAQGSIVHYLDLTKMLGQVNANPAAYGLTGGLACPAFPNSTCIANTAAPYLFYDGVHPTSVGSAIIGRYIATQLAAPPTLQGPSELGFDTGRQWSRTLSSRNDLYRGDAADGLRLYVVGDYFGRNARRTDSSTAFDIKGYGGTIGAEYGMGGGLIGIAGNYSKPRLTFGTDSARDRARSWQVGAYGTLSMGGLFGQAYAGYGNDDHRIERMGVVQGMEARPDGSHVVAGAKAGYLMPIMGVSAGPILAVDYVRAKVDGYTETGDPALTLNVSDQKLRSFTGQLGIEVRGDIAGFHPFVDLTAERDLSANNRVISFSQTSAPTIINSWDASRSKETYGRFSAGGNANITGGVSVDAFVSTTFGRDHGNEVGGQVGVKARF